MLCCAAAVEATAGLGLGKEFPLHKSKSGAAHILQIWTDGLRVLKQFLFPYCREKAELCSAQGLACWRVFVDLISVLRPANETGGGGGGGRGGGDG